jgi:hypothetical protein
MKKNTYLFTTEDRKTKENFLLKRLNHLNHIPRQNEMIRLDEDDENLYMVKFVVHRYYEDRHEIVIHLVGK